ncbi:methyltransferase domain-containing protein [Gemmata sp. JC717]|uniref:class I SAM-dependent methyltransferase n=1 Tax=Gemmata algarum TaxID=2975278 RepID=UPI0021BB8817|nr:methyltransferase domain-containing protein [Gemmata algarum]MDY3554887.1 methyltransferase domain-containing protein [Gemmata algarum]
MRWLDRVLQRWRGSVARRWVPRGSRVLDVGCHHGEFLCALGSRLGVGVGLDPLAPNASGPRWALVRDRFPPASPLPDASFDAVVLLATLEHVPDKDEVARECFRVLRPGGRVVVTVPSRLVDPIVLALARLGLADGMSLDEHHGFNPAETRGLFARHGFRLLRWRPFQLGLNHLFVFAKPQAAGGSDPPQPGSP